MTKLAIVDDHQLVRTALAGMIESRGDCKVILESGKGIGFCDLLKATKVDVVLLDVSMPDQDGFTTCRELCDTFDDVKVLAISALDDRYCVAKMIEAGAVGYVTKNISAEELYGAIQKIVDGGNYFQYELSTIFSKEVFNALDKEDGFGWNDLSEREQEVFKRILEEKTNHEIADELGIGLRTVESHRRKIIEKSESKSIIGAIVRSFRKNGGKPY